MANLSLKDYNLKSPGEYRTLGGNSNDKVMANLPLGGVFIAETMKNGCPFAKAMDYVDQKDKEQEGLVCMTEREGRTAQKIFMSLSGILMIIAAGFLSWNINTVPNMETGAMILRVFYTLIAVVAGVFYLIYYFFAHYLWNLATSKS